MKVVMVDDSAPDRRLCRIFLEEAHGLNLQFFEESEAAQGLKTCRAVTPDCVLLDYRLPGMNGLEFLARLRAEVPQDEPVTAVVLLTGLSTEAVAIEALRSGVQDFLLKEHLSSESLGMVIRNAIQKVSRIRDLRQDRERLKRSLAEKDVLLQEVHHRVKNNFQVIASLLHLQTLATTDPTAADALRASEHRVEAMAMIHEQLYESANLREIALATQTNLLMANLFSSFGVDRSQICGQVNVDPGDDKGPLVLDVNTAIPVLLILNELISNSLRHAFPHGYSGSIRVDAHRRDGQLELMVVDDGIGHSPDLAGGKSRSLGLEIVEILARQLRGTWEWERERGTAFRLSFPER